MGTLRLGVNIDHIATLRQVRYATMPDSKNTEPDPIAAASICERTGAHGITAHLRADRRHIQDRDMERLRANIMTKLNFEMGNTPGILDVAIRIRPDEVCLVPEKRAEVTTEGGLDAIASRRDLLNTIQRLHANGINYRNIALIHRIPHLAELNIGHAIVSRAIFVGWENAVREMLALMENYNG